MSRELDAKLHAALFNVPIEWRLCATDPECGNWEDVQWHDEPHQEGDDLWGHHPVVRQPCYNRLDTDEPLQRGWTAADIASDEYRAHRWRVVPFYSRDIAAAWQVVEALRKRGVWLERLEQKWETQSARAIFEWRVPNLGLRHAQVMGDTPAHAICLAALKAVEP